MTNRQQQRYLQTLEGCDSQTLCRMLLQKEVQINDLLELLEDGLYGKPTTEKQGPRGTSTRTG